MTLPRIAFTTPCAANALTPNLNALVFFTKTAAVISSGQKSAKFWDSCAR